MKAVARHGKPDVRALPGAPADPIKMHIAGVTYRMDADEAIDLANRLVDAAEAWTLTDAIVCEGDR